MADKQYDKQNFLIHDYFFAKTLDKVRPGGVVAFVTSKGTMDKKSPEVRKYLAQRAELLGAVRLPNTAFKENAGTEVTSDILFLKKRDRVMDLEPDWVHLSEDENGIAMNSYFAEHPEMIVGKMEMVSGPYGMESTCMLDTTRPFAQQLQEAVSYIDGEIEAVELDELADELADATIPADPDVKNYSYTLVDDRVYYRENSIMKPVDMLASMQERIKGMESFDVCIMEERVGSDGVKVAIVSLYDTDINLGQILQSLSVEKRFSSRHNIDLNLISFSPDDLVQSYPYKYLNGSLANGMRGGLSSFDIERFGEELDEYGNSGDVLQLLYKIPSFDVVIEDSRKPRKCRLSLYATGKTLTEILDGTEKDANETVAEKLALTTEKKAVEEYPQKAELPDATGKSVVLFDCDFSRAKSISGMVLLDGYSDPFPALIPSVQTKIMKDLKKKKRIKATIISKNENQYILKLKQS